MQFHLSLPFNGFSTVDVLCMQHIRAKLRNTCRPKKSKFCYTGQARLQEKFLSALVEFCHAGWQWHPG